MSKHHKLSFLACIFACLTAGSISYAAEPVNYNAPLSKLEIISLEKHLGHSLEGMNKLAKIDLNDDGIGEYIIHDAKCAETNDLCDIKILTELDGHFHTLGQIKARTIALSNNYTHGVRNLIVYNNDKNDYDASRLIWNAKKSFYVLEGTGT